MLQKPSRRLKSYIFKDVLGLAFSCSIFLDKRDAAVGCAQAGFHFFYVFFPSFKASTLKILQFEGAFWVILPFHCVLRVSLVKEVLLWDVPRLGLVASIHFFALLSAGKLFGGKI